MVRDKVSQQLPLLQRR